MGGLRGRWVVLMGTGHDGCASLSGWSTLWLVDTGLHRKYDTAITGNPGKTNPTAAAAAAAATTTTTTTTTTQQHNNTNDTKPRKTGFRRRFLFAI